MTEGRDDTGRPRRAAATPAERRTVMAELRAFAHPLRLRIYELLAEKPRTTMQVAVLLGEPPTRLYHHVNALEKAGLLRLRETRPIRGTVEKYFEAVRPSGTTPSAETLERSPAARQSARAAANAVFEQARHDLLGSMTDLRAHGDAGPVLLRMLIGTTPAKAAQIRKRLLAFVKTIRGVCKDAAEGDGETPENGPRHWSLTIAFAPPRRPDLPPQRGAAAVVQPGRRAGRDRLGSPRRRSR